MKKNYKVDEKGNEVYTGPGLMATIWASRSSYLFMTPFFIAFIIFTVIPVAAAMVLSFTNFNMVEIPRFIGLDNHVRMFLDDELFIIAV